MLEHIYLVTVGLCRFTHFQWFLLYLWIESDGDFDFQGETADDDERTIEEEEQLDSRESFTNELDDLQQVRSDCDLQKIHCCLQKIYIH